MANSPILIYGPRKSGTTLLQNLIDDSSKNLFTIPEETKLKRFALKSQEANKGNISRLFSFFDRYTNEHFYNNDIDLDEFSFSSLSPEVTREIFDVEKFVRFFNERVLSSIYRAKRCFEHQL